MLLAVAVVSMSCGGSDNKGATPTTTATTDTANPGATAAISTTTAPKVDPKLCPAKALDIAKGPVAIDFWHSMTAANEDALKKLTDKYNAGQSKVKVTLQYQGTYDESLQKYAAGGCGGEVPPGNQTAEEATRTVNRATSSPPH